MNNSSRLKIDNTGFTLMEIIVATSIFAVFIVVIVNVFQNVVEDQRRTIAMQNIQENLRYVLEVMSKEIRQAKRSDSYCESIFSATFNGNNRIFNTAGIDDERIYFRNKQALCVSYSIVNGALARSATSSSGIVDTLATPNELTISDLVFDVRDNDVNSAPGSLIQPLVTWKFQTSFNKLGDRYAAPITIQTSVSSRFYE
jgi:prepilin-type N-terminal cleavage/methylation domain-containing protein